MLGLPADDPDPAGRPAVGAGAVGGGGDREATLVVGLDELGLPVPVSDGYHGLAVDLLSSQGGPVTTGYHNGVVTLDLAETDDEHRERVRAQLAEPVRTVLGHLRHELGHYYAEVLGLTSARRAEVQARFGDETATDYGGGALQAHDGRGTGSGTTPPPRHGPQPGGSSARSPDPRTRPPSASSAWSLTW